MYREAQYKLMPQKVSSNTPCPENSRKMEIYENLLFLDFKIKLIFIE